MTASASSNTTERASAAPRGEILVVDDQEENLILVSRYLRTEGHGVRWAKSGEEALEAIAVKKPDLVLLDIIMRGLSGFDVCRQIKSAPETLDIPVILVTGLDSRADRVKGIDSGADDFLTKPVNKEELIARVRSLMRLAVARRALENERLRGEVEKRESLQRLFSRYMAPRLVDAIMARSDTLEHLLSGQTRVVAVVLFADIRGFTRMSELLDPDAVVKLLNEFFTTITAVTYEAEGTVFNMAGDSLLVGFGVPLPQEDAALRAVNAACRMQQQFRPLAAKWAHEHGIDAGLGIGIDRGNVIVGNVGSPTYMNYTMIGDTVNVASRITDRAERDQILISENVFEALGSSQAHFRPRPLVPIQVKGKAAPLRVILIPSDVWNKPDQNAA